MIIKKILDRYWPYFAVFLFWGLIAFLLFSFVGCNRTLKKENEMLRQELAHAQQYVPLKRDTIRDTVEVVTQKVVEVEKVKEVLTKEDKELLKDLGTKISALESYQKIGLMTQTEVALSSPTLSQEGAVMKSDSKSEDNKDSVLTYKDAWLDLKYNTMLSLLSIQLHDSLAIAVEKEYKKKFLWWRWGTKGYQVKVVSFNPYTTVNYNSYVKRKR